MKRTLTVIVTEESHSYHLNFVFCFLHVYLVYEQKFLDFFYFREFCLIFHALIFSASFFSRFIFFFVFSIIHHAICFYFSFFNDFFFFSMITFRCFFSAHFSFFRLFKISQFDEFLSEFVLVFLYAFTFNILLFSISN